MADKSLLSQEEMRKLIKEAQAGSKEAEAILVEKNKRLVWQVVERFKHQGADIQDLFQIGIIGLIEVIRNFNLDYGFKFSSYAVPFITGRIQKFLRGEHKPVRIPRPILDLSVRILDQNLENCSVEHICKVLGVKDKEVVKDTLQYIHSGSRLVDSIEKPLGDEGNEKLRLSETLSGDVNGDNWIEHISLKEAIQKLTERERKMIVLRYFHDKTQEEIAKKLSISQAHVSRIEKKAIEKLRELLKEDTDMSQASGDREKAIELLKTTNLTHKEISRITGVPYGTMGHLSKKYRDPKVAKKNRQHRLGVVKEKVKQQTEKTEEKEQSMSDQEQEQKQVQVQEQETVEQQVQPVPQDTSDSLDFELSISLKGKESGKKSVVTSLKKVIDVIETSSTEEVDLKLKISKELD